MHVKPLPPGVAVRVSVVVESTVSVLPNASSSATTTEKVVPAWALSGGAVVSTSFFAAPGVTTVVPTAGVSPADAAVSV